MATTTSLYRIKRTSTGNALLDFNLDYPGTRVQQFIKKDR